MRSKSGIGHISLAAIVTLIGAMSLYPAQAADVFVTENITMSDTWTADNTYILTQVIYVTDGATLTIEAGTTIRGESESTEGANDPGTLVISRGSKLRALGTPSAPIVFTDLDDDNIGANPGNFPYDESFNAISETGNWGGLILLGRGYVSNDTAVGPNPARENQIEGLTALGGLGLYGGCSQIYNPGPDPSICDDEDSGTLNYVSIRYGGFNLADANEINGLTLGAVGRQTAIDYVEIFQNKDDGIELFGGAANIKHMIIANVGDDSVDYDEGWRGKGQFVFAMQGIPGLADKSDKGGEWDGGNSPDSSQPFAIPTFYNATFIGLGQKNFDGNDRNTCIHQRDNAGGRTYNSFCGNFGGASVLIEGGSDSSTAANTSGERSQTPYGPIIDNELYFPPDASLQLEHKNDVFWCIDRQEGAGAGTLCSGDCTQWGGDAGKVHHDNGLFDDATNTYVGCAEPLPIRALTQFDLAFDPTKPDQTIGIDPRPSEGSALWTGARPTPTGLDNHQGFFEPAAYRGAFGDVNWADGWTTMSRLGYFPKATVQVDANIARSQTWTSDNEYVLGQVIYVTDGATLTIEPCTVIRGESESTEGANDPGTLVISRGSKIQAVGTADCPITFTDLDDDNIGASPGTFPYDEGFNAISETGKWGGLILLGRGYVSNDTAAGPNPDRENQIEGLTALGGLGLYGGCSQVYDPVADPSVCDDEDSGTLNYVSLRYGGFNLADANEINGLTLGAVGRETEIDYFEVFQNKDDGIEFFGGAANIKHFVIANVGDDSIDYDEGWRGKGQFTFAMQGIPGLSDKSDKGGEWDGGNSPDSSRPLAIPTFYNATFIGLGQKNFDGNDRNTCIHQRDNAGGRTYNSFCGNFGGAAVLIEGGSSSSTDFNTSGKRSTLDYSNLLDNEIYFPPNDSKQLEHRDDVFWCIDRQEGAGAGTLCSGDCTQWGGDAGKLHHDNGLFSDTTNTYVGCADPLPISALTQFDLAFDPTKPDQTISIDPRPSDGSPLATAGRVTPQGDDNSQDFFVPANHTGAFAPGRNWAQCWTTMSRLGYFPACSEDTPYDALGGLSFDSASDIQWGTPPSCSGSLSYDLLRSNTADDFTSANLVVDSGSVPYGRDEQLPAAGASFYYLVRATDTSCDGTLGFNSGGAQRVGP